MAGMTEHELTRKELLAAGVAIGGIGLAMGRLGLPEEAEAASFVPFGWPQAAGTATTPHPSIYLESQGWWHQGDPGAARPGADWAHTSSHVHWGLAFPLGELAVKEAGTWRFPGFAQLHNFQGGTAHWQRGGFLAGDGSSAQQVGLNWKPTSVDEARRVDRIQTANAATGVKEARFTINTTSPFGKRMYQSTGWRGWLTGTPAATGATARGWYASTDYTNITIKTPFRASAPLRAGQTIAYSCAQGGNFPFAYADPNLHAGSKGTVLLEATAPRTSGTVTIPAGAKVLLIGCWERGPDGWNAGVLRVPLA